MSINLSELKRENIRCLIYEENGSIKTIYENFEKVKQVVENPIEIYNPNMKQKELILNLLTNNLNVKDTSIDASISDEDVLLTLFSEITNIYLDLNKERDKELISEILKDPSPVLMKAKLEIEKIIYQEFLNWYENVKMLSNSPMEIQEIIVNGDEREEEAEVKEENTIEELERKLEELKLNRNR
ncbi:MAG: hypothetical protein AB2417_15835 [Clostridiaceae bacterium]